MFTVKFDAVFLKLYLPLFCFLQTISDESYGFSLGKKNLFISVKLIVSGVFLKLNHTDPTLKVVPLLSRQFDFYKLSYLNK